MQDLEENTLWWNGPKVLMSQVQSEGAEELTQENETNAELKSKHQVSYITTQNT